MKKILIQKETNKSGMVTLSVHYSMAYGTLVFDSQLQLDLFRMFLNEMENKKATRISLETDEEEETTAPMEAETTDQETQEPEQEPTEDAA